MKTLPLSLLIALLLAFTVSAQTPARDDKEPATIAGTVTNGGRPASDATMALMPVERSERPKPIAKATTDEQGRYQLTKVPPGRYRLRPLAPGFVVAELSNDPWAPGQTLNVAAGDDIQNLNFTLTRGGVIAGRVTDADGKPVVEEHVHLLSADAEEHQRSFFNPFSYTTDDRGVYRIYGLPPGRYLVFVGEAKDSGVTRGGDIGGFYAQTFHPGVEEKTQAKVVEVTTGAEVSGTDIPLGKLKKTYEVAGRVVDEAGRPVVGAYYAHGAVSAEGRFNGGFASNSGQTNERGEFRATGFTPGRWAMWASSSQIFNDEQSTTYSDAVPLEVVDRNISGIELKLHRGASVSGVVQIQGASDPAILTKLPELKLAMDWSSADTLTPPRWSQTPVKPDGSFQITGLRPGKTKLYLGWGIPKGFTLLSVRRDGIEQSQGIELRAGEQVSNVRVVVAYGTNVLRGQVQFQNAARPASARLGVLLTRAGSGTRIGYAEIDALGRFTFEHLSTGEYEIELYDYSRSKGYDDHPPPLLKKAFTISGDGGETQLTIAYDFSKPTPGNEQEDER